MSKPLCFIENQLYLQVGGNKATSKQSSLIKTTTKPTTQDNFHYFPVDTKFEYQPFFEDFGPLHLAHVYFFCKIVDLKIKELAKTGEILCVVTSHNGKKLANAAWLMCAYMLVRRNHTPEDAFGYVKDMYPSFIPFRDPSQSPSTFDLTILDCLRGLAKGIEFGFFDYENFNGEEYLFYEQVDNGDLNWIVPGKCIACCGPHAKRVGNDGYIHFTPDDYIDMFNRWGVSCVVRLNKKMYEARRFTQHGINHYDLYFVDGGIPSDAIVKKFLKIWETEKCVVVHCKAGLGRTGTCIGCAFMKYYRMTALEAIAWLRIARPGSVIGIQQHFLQEIQEKMWKEGDKWRQKQAQPDDTIALYRLTTSSSGGTRKLLFNKRKPTTASTSTQQSLSSGNSTLTLSLDTRSAPAPNISGSIPTGYQKERSSSRNGVSMNRSFGPINTVGVFGNIPGDSRVTPFSQTSPIPTRTGTPHNFYNTIGNTSILQKRVPLSSQRKLLPLKPLQPLQSRSSNRKGKAKAKAKVL